MGSSPVFLESYSHVSRKSPGSILSDYNVTIQKKKSPVKRESQEHQHSVAPIPEVAIASDSDHHQSETKSKSTTRGGKIRALTRVNAFCIAGSGRPGSAAHWGSTWAQCQRPEGSSCWARQRGSPPGPPPDRWSARPPDTALFASSGSPWIWALQRISIHFLEDYHRDPIRVEIQTKNLLETRRFSPLLMKSTGLVPLVMFNQRIGMRLILVSWLNYHTRGLFIETHHSTDWES